MYKTELIENELFIKAIYDKYGYDFSNYARASLNRRIRELVMLAHKKSASDLIPLLFHDENYINTVLHTFSITVTEMFRDPEVFLSIRNNVLPYLKTFPHLKIWNAGCATGEEVYSTAILLEEENLLQISTIYGTDINANALKIAKESIYKIKDMKGYIKNYQSSGGIKPFSDYYLAKYDSAIINGSLRKNIVFAQHNLTSDEVFTETHLVMCRNVMIYFNQELQNRALELFTESLLINGFLVIGNKESLEFSTVKDRFKIIDRKNRIYQKIR